MEQRIVARITPNEGCFEIKAKLATAEAQEAWSLLCWRVRWRAFVWTTIIECKHIHSLLCFSYNCVLRFLNFSTLKRHLEIGLFQHNSIGEARRKQSKKTKTTIMIHGHTIQRRYTKV